MRRSRRSETAASHGAWPAAPFPSRTTAEHLTRRRTLSSSLALHEGNGKPLNGRRAGCHNRAPVRGCCDRGPGCYDAAMEIQERTDTLISLTPAAAAKIKQLMESESDVNVLRVAIEGGGCSGFQYGLGFDRS